LQVFKSQIKKKEQLESLFFPNDSMGVRWLIRLQTHPGMTADEIGKWRGVLALA
jgi:hypothetical protein